MTKQEHANAIYELAQANGFDRKTTIFEIVKNLKCSDGYASTLYNNARKAAKANSVPTVTGIVPTEKFGAGWTPNPEYVSPNTIEKFTSSNIDEVQRELKAAMDAVMKRHGLSVKFGNIRYTGDSYRTQMTISVGDAGDAARKEFNRLCGRYGLKPEHFGAQFVTPTGRRFTISGINPKRRNYPISGVSERGARYKFPANEVINGLGK